MAAPVTLAPSHIETASHVRATRWGKLRRIPITVQVSIAVLIVMVLLVVLAPVFTAYEPSQMNLRARLMPPFVDAAHILGTDATGRDMAARILYGGQVSLLVGGLATLVGLLAGTLLGIVSGYVRGWADALITYIIDLQLALPFLLLAVAVALILGTSPLVLILLAALSTLPLVARLVRGLVLSLREREFVLAAHALGATPLHIMRLHLFPNLTGALLVLATLSVGRIILLESSLSFLGIGVQPPTPAWGVMINEGRQYLAAEWWLSTLPGLALVLLTMAIGTIGDWLRDRLDVAAG
jgi:peptide/nickel transport system permease protein